MQHDLEIYLQQRGAPVSAVDLAQHLFKLQAVAPETAERFIAALALENPRLVRDEAGLWRLSKDEPAQSGLKSVDFLLFQALPTSAIEWQNWQMVGYAVARADSPLRPERIHIGADRKAVLKLLQRLPRLLDMHPVFLCGVGNQLSLLRHSVQQVAGVDPDLPSLSLLKIANRLFPNQVATLTDLDTILGFTPYQFEDLTGQLCHFHAQVQSVVELLCARQVDTLEKLTGWLLVGVPEIDFSGYGFDRPFLEALPQTPGVYLMLNRSGTVFYVGKSKNLQRRIRSYFSNPAEADEKLRAIREHVYTIQVISTGSEVAALLQEDALIQQHNPALNRQVHVHPRPARKKHRYPRILILPDLDPENVCLLLLHPERGMESHIIPRQGAAFSQLEQQVLDWFFSKAPGAGERDRRMEIVLSWLSDHDAEVNSLDMRKFVTSRDAMRAMRHYLCEPPSSEKVVFY